MKRLTYFDGGKWRLKIGDTEYSGKAVDRLAAYEDTGLEPETISKIRDIVLDISGDLDRLRELAQAHKENRVLPEGDVVWWVHCSGKVYQGVIEGITCCDYQGALYCHIYSPSFRLNPYPTVHYSYVFKSKDEAKDFSKYQRENPDSLVPMCMGCHYAMGNREAKE